MPVTFQHISDFYIFTYQKVFDMTVSDVRNIPTKKVRGFKSPMMDK